ncbi:MAG: HEPN domain-containing protein [Nitrospirota bacterium]
MIDEILKKKKLIEEKIPDFKQIQNHLKRAIKDIRTAKATLEIDAEWTYTICYQAMLRAAKALMFVKGYRPKGKDQHKTVIQFAKDFLGEEFKTLIGKFDRMRRKRHDFIYEPDQPISEYEAQKALEDAEKFIKKIIEITQLQNPQIILI